MGDPTVIAVDWSGRVGADQIHYIRSAVIEPDGAVSVWSDLTRSDVIEELIGLTGDVIVGFDFSFGYPSWAARTRDIDGPEMWDVVKELGEDWLASCPEPFFGRPGTRMRRDIELFRETEKPHPAKSTFQIGGAGAVGTGSIRGMPHLSELRNSGFAVWPFDQATGRTVVEIYPRILRPFADVSRLPARIARAVANHEDTRDAVLSALVMWRERETIAAMDAAIDPVTRLEGDVWTPRDKPA